eukprot:TRINITY_DN6657_c0_g1_i2.p1 TRINITY_DN6657_c0_g1~~TRINITY_DN6657_c0_g1_i2.p1  ORF type:complete len:238 (+),score=43.60 TRINITY_DN6657_c0_g1_i2:160-873(+)
MSATTHTFPASIQDGHIIANIGKGSYVIDTGSPFSMGNGSVFIGEQTFPLQKASGFGVNIEELAELSGLVNISGLLGMNIMINYDVTFTRNSIAFREEPLGEVEETDKILVLPIISQISGIPVVSLTIAGAKRRIFFDTGAKISYLSDEFLVGESAGLVVDFYPTMGKFTTETYEIDITIGKKSPSQLQMIFGRLPQALTPLLIMGDAKGIIGSHLLDHFDITLCSRDKKLILEKTN